MSSLPQGLPRPAMRALEGAGFDTLEQISGTSDQELLALHGMGPKALGILRLASRPAALAKSKAHTVYHKDGSVWAKGKVLDGLPIGYWEWFRKDGTKMRSGSFKDGKQVGEWITYDKSGSPFKTTQFDKK